MSSPKKIPIRKGSYTIQQSLPKPVPLEIRPHIFNISNVVTWILWSIYMVSQSIFAYSIQLETDFFIWRMWIILLTELFLSFQEGVYALSIILGSFGVTRTEARPSYRLTGGSAPSIDVLITCCGEPVQVIVDTVKAAAAQDYPSALYRIFVLDDGHDEKLQRSIELFSAQLDTRNAPHVHYLSRQIEPRVKSYFKAGNLNFGIEETFRQGGSAFIAGLDADMISQPHWLSTMVPHLILDDRMAIAVTPQVSHGPKYVRKQHHLMQASRATTTSPSMTL